MRKCMEHVKLLLDSRTDCIWINTLEEADVIKDIREIVQSYANMKMFVWSNTEGVKQVATVKGESTDEPDPKTRDILGLFSYIKRMMEDNKSGIFVLRDLHPYVNGQDPRGRRCIRDIKEYKSATYTPIIVIAPTDNINEEISRLFKIVDYDLPGKQEISTLVNQANKRAHDAQKKGYKPVPDIEDIIKACSGLTSIEIEHLLFFSLKKTKTLDIGLINEHKIEVIKKSGLLEYKQPQVSLADIGGHKILKKWLTEQKELFTEEAREFGLKIPKGFLALGCQGTGKTAIAEAIAYDLGVPLLTLNLAKVMSSRVGASEQGMEQALRIAKSIAPCVMLVDEVEKQIGGINSSNNTDGGVISRMFQSLLRFLQDNDNGVYTILTSNDVSMLPPELTRAGRLDAQWFFDLPTREERKDIFNIYYKKFDYTPDKEVLNYSIEISDGYTGSEIRESVNNIMRKVFIRAKKDKNIDVTEEDVKQGIEEVIPVSKSSKEKIEALKTWVKGRARFTNGEDPIGKKSRKTFNPLGL